MTTIIGVDPDWHNTGVCFIRDGKVSAMAVRIDENLKGRAALIKMAHTVYEELYNDKEEVDVLCVEYPLIMRNSQASPESILGLAMVVGAVTAAVVATHTYLVRPQEWKGTVAKSIHQKRLMKAYELRGGDLKTLDFNVKSHVLDAFGIAEYAETHAEFMKEVYST